MPRGVCLVGVCPKGVCLWSLPGGCLPRGMCLGGLLGVSAWGMSAQGCTHLPVNRMTDRCKNITFPQTSFVDGNK